MCLPKQLVYKLNCVYILHRRYLNKRRPITWNITWRDITSVITTRLAELNITKYQIGLALNNHPRMRALRPRLPQTESRIASSATVSHEGERHNILFLWRRERHLADIELPMIFDVINMADLILGRPSFSHCLHDNHQWVIDLFLAHSINRCIACNVNYYFVVYKHSRIAVIYMVVFCLLILRHSSEQ